MKAGLNLVLVLVALSGTAAARPQSSISEASAQGYPFLVHGGSGDAALIAKIRDAADRAWRAEIDQGGWPSPAPDRGGPDSRFDIYVDGRLGPGEAYVVPEQEITTTTFFDQASYMGLPRQFASDAELSSYVAHELNHGSQFAIDAAESDVFFEHTAVFVEKAVANDVATYGVGIGDFQAHPERALVYIGQDYYEYGAALWVMYLSEKLDGGGAALVQRLWLDGQQVGRTNRPSWLDVLDTILTERNLTPARFFAGFSVARYFTGSRSDGSHFAAGADWGASSLIPVDTAALSGAPVTLPAAVGAMGTKLWQLDLAPGIDALEITLSGPDPALGAAPLDANGRALSDDIVVSGTAVTRAALPLGTTRVIVALTCVPAGYDPNARDFAARQISATIAIAPALPVTDGGVPADDLATRPDDAGTIPDGAATRPDDAGTIPDDAATSAVDAGTGGHDAGCGCRVAARPGRAGSSLALLAVVLWLAARRRIRARADYRR